MFRALFGTGSTYSMLRGGLEEQSATQRGIAARVAQATAASSSQPFTDQLTAKLTKTKQPALDLNREMASLADTNLRYEATSKLLQGAYTQLRTAVNGNG